MRVLAVCLVAVASIGPGSQRGLVAQPGPVTLGRAVVALTGPWAFHTGDDPRWADPSFDDSRWESVDLTAPANAHDPDVGLTGYVRGWTARGHAGYSGYAWYRLHVVLSRLAGDSIALIGPADVEDAYQFFVNGTLVGGSGRFSGPTPVVYGAQPRMFQVMLPAPRGAGAPESTSVVVAVRVWASPSTIAGAPGDAGGIHIAPAIGEAGTIRARYRLQWLETFYGYVVEVALPLSFLVLVIMACSVYVTDGRDPAYLWLSAALIATGIVRANQAFFFWTQAESLDVFAVVKEVVFIPLALGAWMMAWYAWFRPDAPVWLPRAIGALTVLFALSQLLATPYTTLLVAPPVSAIFQQVSIVLHLCFAAMLIVIVAQGTRRVGWDTLALVAVALVAVGQFAYELSVLHVPGIWFPFGVGVSRAQFAYAAMDVALFALLLRRHLLSARPAPAPAAAP